ncbi:MAG TPA: choice-of-anchor tandem repeat GloVer-containing protein [Terriglobales bacterium]|nr:choice-of-anchor tandem repeat GloVer-containing protein [Terriglobales bacterium]
MKQTKDLHANLKLAFLAGIMTVVFVLASLANAQTYTTLYAYPEDTRNDTGIGLAGLMTQGQDGNLYGTIGDDGSNAAGSAFKMTTAGQFTRIYSFCSQPSCADGSGPWGGLTLNTDGNLYGTTTTGGKSAAGTVFKLTPNGTLTTLWSFDNGTDAGAPWYPPFQGLDGKLYGVSNTVYNGDYGAFIRLTPTKTPPDTEKVLVDFNYTNGNDPNLPTQGTDGNFYGTAVSGGTKGLGVVYKITTAGKIIVLHNFVGYPSDGTYPLGALVEGNDGDFYGVTYQGGANNIGAIFKITRSGTFTLLHSFASSGTTLDGAYPRSGLILGSDGNLYGTTLHGGKANDGALYEITPEGAVTILYSLCSLKGCADGFSTATPLTQHTNGKFYGSTSGNSLGGSYFYSLDLGLKPFAKLVNWSAKDGAKIEILGQGFTGATGVSFNGVAASFNNVSDTYMTATVPVGALTGPVTVTTFTSTLTSDRNFLVTPQVTSFSPASGVVGTVISITGVSLTQTTGVTIGGKAASFTVNSDSNVTATVPAGAKTGATITISTAGGTASSKAKLVIVPSIASFTPTSGPVGTSVTITGNSFTGTNKVTFGGIVATSYKAINDTQVDALVPTGAATGPIAVTTAGGTGTSTTSFTVTQ